MPRRGQTTRALWIGLVLMTVMVAMPAWSATVPKAKFAKNAGKLDGMDSTAFALAGHAHAGGDITSGTISSERIGDGAGSGLDADTLDGIETSTTKAADVVYVSDAIGFLPPDVVGPNQISNVARRLTIPVHQLDEAYTTGTFPQKKMVGPAPALGFDASTPETVSFAFQMPPDVVISQGALGLYWSSGATSGNVVWGMSVRLVALDQAVDTGGDSTTFPGLASPVGVTANAKRLTTFSLSPLSGLQLDPLDTVFISVTRNTGDAGDTAAGDAHLHAIELTYMAQQ